MFGIILLFFIGCLLCVRQKLSKMAIFCIFTRQHLHFQQKSFKETVSFHNLIIIYKDRPGADVNSQAFIWFYLCFCQDVFESDRTMCKLNTITQKSMHVINVIKSASDSKVGSKLFLSCNIKNKKILSFKSMKIFFQLHTMTLHIFPKLIDFWIIFEMFQKN